MICVFCNKATRKYTKWNDWDSRNSHYRCWKRNEQDKMSKAIMEDFIKEQKRKQEITDALLEMKYAQL